MFAIEPRKLFLSFILAVAVATCQSPTGDILGTVFDESGAVMPGATVHISNKETAAVRTLKTSAGGVFSAPALNAGLYEVRVEAPGFRTLLREATVEAGGATTVDMHMQIGATKDVVTVEAVTPQLDYDRHTIDGVVTRQQIQSLPLNGRSFLQLAFLEPGVTVSAGAQGQYNRAFDVSVLGSDSGTTRITVDGGSVRDAVTGGTQQNFSQETVQEFQVSTSNFDLSTGIGAGGAVNVVSRTGGNQFHGSGFFFFRDHNLSAYPALQRNPLLPDPFFARKQPGFWVGGPAKKDKLFFFFNYERNDQKGVFSAQPNDPALQSFTTLTSSPFTGNLVGTRIDWRINEKNTAFVRYSHDGNHAFAPRGGGLPSGWVSNRNYADSGVASLITSLKPTLVNEFRYSMSFWSNQNTPPSATECPGCLGLGGPHVDVEGSGLSFGNQTNSPQTRVPRGFGWSDNMTWQRGGHRFKFGGEWEFLTSKGTYSIDEPAAMTLYSPAEIKAFAPQLLPLLPKTFTTLQDILRLPLKSFAFGIGDNSQPPPFQRDKANHDNTIHVYFQDTWKIRPRFTLNYGLGYTYETNALNHDLSRPQWLAPIYGSGAGLGPEKHAPLHFSPAFGFSYAATKDNKTVIRGGVGVYYDTINIELRLIERNYLGPFGSGYLTLGGSSVPNPIPGIPGVPVGKSLDFSSGPTPFSGAILTQILGPVLAGIKAQIPAPSTNLAVTTIGFAKSGTDLFWRDYVPPTAQHFNLGVQRQITSDFAITADFVYRHFIHLTQRSVDANKYNRYINGVQTPVIRICGTKAGDGAPNADCSTGGVGVTGSGGTSVYRGLLVKADKRFSHRYQAQVSYALQFQNGINGIQNLDNLFQNRGVQGSLHNLNISGVVDLPFKFQISAISSYTSAGAFIPSIPGIDLTGSGVTGFQLPGLNGEAFNRGLGKGDLVRLVDQYNQNYAGKKGPVPGQVFPRITLPGDYQLGKGSTSQDVRVTKYFQYKERYKLDLFVEGFNVFNIANLGGYSGNLLDANFGQATSRAGNIFGSGGPRAFQVGGRISF